ncbi:sialate O-acetylesterase [uncultured Polaribacter sp.]|uniref:sialate O-acetylesterase n=1 Tax=uncultured Polaribacter sp. TaxID=174711 RepID=UPI0026033F16|nr:sialate O-acetylesterase [uncultured Polaribacter sp.]
MKKITFKFLGIVFFLMFIETIDAAIKLPAIVSSNMVLQRNTEVVLWGWADPEEKITINTSWLKKTFKIRADKNGNWRIEVNTTNSKNAQSIEITSKTSGITLENILFGEVWLCSGQSNMQQSMMGYGGQPTFDTALPIARSNNFNLRLFTVNRVGSKTPQKDLKKYTPWQQASPKNVSEFSAIAYFFGQQLQEILDCPVGLIHTSWGGSSVEAWMSKEAISTYQKVNLENRDLKKRTNSIPTALFNGMIHPLIPYTIKGMLWYQGESNRMQPEKYKKFFPAMVKDWRKRWEIGGFPFFYVQIAPYLYGNNEVFQKVENTAFIREAQLQCLDLIPNSGIAITMDIGDKESIHPPKKKEVADRLLLNALHKTYGYTSISYASPVYTSLEIKDNSILLKFKNNKKGLYSYDGLSGFEIAGDDKVFYPAVAKIVNRKNVLVTSTKVPNPIAVRYAWKNWINGTLYNGALLPASSFRTDTWNDATRAEK